MPSKPNPTRFSRRQFTGMAAATGLALTAPMSRVFASTDLKGTNPPSQLMYGNFLEDYFDEKRHALSTAYTNLIGWHVTPANRSGLSKILTDMKYEVSVDDHEVRDGHEEATKSEEPTIPVRNLIAKLSPGSTPTDALTYVICAHLDTTMSSPGANDNGTGAAAVLELARCFSSLKDKACDHNLHFIFFGGEELGLLGSEKYCSDTEKFDTTKSAKFRVINFDTIGRKNLGTVQYVMEYRSNNIQNFHSSISAKFDSSGELETHKLYESPTTSKASRKPSDHLSFFKVVDGVAVRDVPVVSISQKAEDHLMHSPEDVRSKVDVPTAFRACERAYLYLLDEVPA